MKSNNRVEVFFQTQSSEWELINDKKYKEVINNWEGSFKTDMIENTETSKGDRAVLMLQEKLPFNAFIFNVPNYKYLPVTPSSYDSTFGYRIMSLKNIDREEFNASEVIICDENFTFMCAFNHEGMSMAPELYYETSA